jgi:TorA maturation chaperone TorD
VKNALHVIPGKFVASGHDYRKDLARFVSLAYDLPIDAERLERIERALRRRELLWAERRLTTQQLSDAEEKVKKQLTAWGVREEYLPLSFVAPGPQEADPFDARVLAD